MFLYLWKIGNTLFSNEGRNFSVHCLPNYLASTPRWFTKIIKALFAELKKTAYVSTNYIYGCLLIRHTSWGSKKEYCPRNIFLKQCTNANYTYLCICSGHLLIKQVRILSTPYLYQTMRQRKDTHLGFVLHSAYMNVKQTKEMLYKSENSCYISQGGPLKGPHQNWPSVLEIIEN